MNDKQLELSINGGKVLLNPAPRNRQARANWWFTQMRNIVGRAMDWENAGSPRPEQIWIPGAHREVKV